MRLQGLSLWIFIFVVVYLLVGVLWWWIYRRAGMRGQTGLLMLVPILNLFLFFYFALAPWPIEKELKELRRSAGAPSAGGAPPRLL